MALQGKITTNRSIQAGGLKSKTIVARNMTTSPKSRSVYIQPAKPVRSSSSVSRTADRIT